jgi:hypothetical protein
LALRTRVTICGGKTLQVRISDRWEACRIEPKDCLLVIRRGAAEYAKSNRARPYEFRGLLSKSTNVLASVPAPGP